MPTDILVNSNQTIASLTSYRAYVAMITQSGTGAPTAIVLNSEDANYLGDIVWSRLDVGSYIGTLADSFPEVKTFILFGNQGGNTILSGGFQTIDEVYLETLTTADSATKLDNLLFNTPIEIRVYP